MDKEFLVPSPISVQPESPKSRPVFTESVRAEVRFGMVDTGKETTLNEDLDDLISEDNKLSRGRPRKNLELSTLEFRTFISRELGKQFTKINS